MAQSVTDWLLQKLRRLERDTKVLSSQIFGTSAGGTPTLESRIITLDIAGAHRDLGRVTLLVEGIGGTSAVRGCLNWTEIR